MKKTYIIGIVVLIALLVAAGYVWYVYTQLEVTEPSNAVVMSTDQSTYVLGDNGEVTVEIQVENVSDNTIYYDIPCHTGRGYSIAKWDETKRLKDNIALCQALPIVKSIESGAVETFEEIIGEIGEYTVGFSYNNDVKTELSNSDYMYLDSNTSLRAASVSFVVEHE